MENATKALLIAGGVLIAIIILSIAVFLYSMYSDQAEEYSAIISAIELEKFNNKFLGYLGRDDITAQELVSIVNLSKEYNYKIKIYLSNTQLKFDETNTQEEFIKNKQDKTFKCQAKNTGTNRNPKYNNYGQIIRLKFIEN